MTERSEIKGGFTPLKRFAFPGILYALDCFVAPSPRLITIDEKTVVSSAHRGREEETYRNICGICLC